jgi:hypothetical protein
VTCPKCAAEIPIGGWPFCPHEPAQPAVIGDEMDYIDHNLGREPVHIRSRAQRRQLMAERGLTEAVRHVPVPGSDKSPHTQAWVSVDLEAATALVSRGAVTVSTPDEARFREGVQTGWHGAGQVPDWTVPA